MHLSTDYNKNRLTPKRPTLDVYDQIIEDLSLAEKLIPATYPMDSRIRPNQQVVRAFLARVYLYLENYEEAEKRATEVLSDSQYQLEDDLLQVFRPASRETIWQLFPTHATYNTTEGLNFIPSSATVRPPLAFYDGVLEAFEPSDTRLTSWTQSRVVGGIEHVYPYKYVVRSSTSKLEYIVAIRLAEIYLIRAESLAHLNRVPEAMDDINRIRGRAGLNSLSSSISKNDCLDAIVKERRLEYLSEWGHRWFDLKRLGIMDEEMVKTKPNWRSEAAIFPTPEMEYLRNPAL